MNGEALVDDEGYLLGAVVAMHDVTEQKRNEERLAVLAMHDPLTGLANRTLLATRLQAAIDNLAEHPPSEAGIGEGPGVAVFLLDLDEFKEINDVLGHDVGDDMLVAVARRLLSIVRPSDTVARLGGDEFVVVCDVENGEEEMLRIADRISTALARPYRIDGRTLGAMASVGGVFADNPDTDPSRLLEPRRRRDVRGEVEPSARTPFDDGLKREVGADSPATPTLRIVTVCPYSLSRPGGVQSQAVGLTRALGARGHQATLYAPLDHPGDAPVGIDFESVRPFVAGAFERIGGAGRPLSRCGRAVDPGDPGRRARRRARPRALRTWRSSGAFRRTQPVPCWSRPFIAAGGARGTRCCAR